MIFIQQLNTLFKKFLQRLVRKNFFVVNLNVKFHYLCILLVILLLLDLDSALMNIDKIIHQGEGTSKVNPTLDNDDLAHYYRFLEIYRGQRIIAKYEKDVHYYLSDEKIDYDPEQVYPMKQQDGPVVLPVWFDRKKSIGRV